jgi:hypothetical protein
VEFFFYDRIVTKEHDLKKRLFIGKYFYKQFHGKSFKTYNILWILAYSEHIWFSSKNVFIIEIETIHLKIIINRNTKTILIFFLLCSTKYFSDCSSFSWHFK